MAIWESSTSQYVEEEEEEQEDSDDDEEENSDDETPPSYHNYNLQFSIALQELRSIQSHLYSAAEYCESAYMYSDQKQSVFENLKDYSVKALVNAVDHVGTVAFKLNETLSQCTNEISVMEVNVACLTERLRACHERANCEGLKQYQRVKRRPRYGQHYILSENLAGALPKAVGKQWMCVLQPSPDKSLQPLQGQVESDSNMAKSLSWHLASKPSLISSNKSTPTAPHVNRSTSSNFRGDKKSVQGSFSRSLSGGQFSRLDTSNRAQEQDQSLGSSKSLLSLLSLDETKRHGAHIPKKSFLSSFLGRNKSGKPRRLGSLTSFKQ